MFQVDAFAWAAQRIRTPLLPTTTSTDVALAYLATGCCCCCWCCCWSAYSFMWRRFVAARPFSIAWCCVHALCSRVTLIARCQCLLYCSCCCLLLCPVDATHDNSSDSRQASPPSCRNQFHILEVSTFCTMCDAYAPWVKKYVNWFVALICNIYFTR